MAKDYLYKINMSTFDDLIAKLKQTDTYIIGLLEKEAMPKINDLIIFETQNAAPVRYGYLKKAIVSKTLLYKGGQVLVGIYGVDSQSGLKSPWEKKYKPRRYRNGVIAERKGPKTYTDYIIRPSKYFHLVELGTKFKAANPFFTTAFNDLKPAIDTIFRQTFEKAVQEAGL